MAEQEPTIRSRELGEELRWAMERANLSGKRAAVLLGWSESKVSRVLTGRLVIKEADLSAFLAICVVRGAERARLMNLARRQDTAGWLQQYGASVPEQTRTLISHESRATRILLFDPSFVPGLLQTEDYARAVLERVATVPPDEVDLRTAARMNRQLVFSSDYPPRCTFFVHEFALRLPVGSTRIMSEQLHHLLRMSVRSYIAIRVIPAVVGAHSGVTGPCRLMESAEFRSVVYVEGETVGLFLEEPEEIAAYDKVFTSFDNCALDQAQSKKMIAELAIDLYADREDKHGRP